MKIKVYYLLVSNKLSSIEGFSFMALCLGVLGNLVCYCRILQAVSANVRSHTNRRASLVRLKNTDQLYSLKIAKGFYNDESETIMTRFAG